MQRRVAVSLGIPAFVTVLGIALSAPAVAASAIAQASARIVGPGEVAGVAESTSLRVPTIPTTEAARIMIVTPQNGMTSTGAASKLGPINAGSIRAARLQVPTGGSFALTLQNQVTVAETPDGGAVAAMPYTLSKGEAPHGTIGIGAVINISGNHQAGHYQSLFDVSVEYN